MNKIVIDSDNYNLDSFSGFITINSSNLVLNISGDVKIYLHSVFNLKLNLEDNAKLEVYIYEKDKQNDSKIEIVQNNNTYLEFEHIYCSKKDISENIDCTLVGNDNNTNINMKIVQEKGKSTVLEQITALDDTYNNEAVESLKGLCENGVIEALPNMQINTNNIICNHLVSVTSYDTDELFYLISKGLSKNNAKKLIKKGYLKDKYKLEKGESYE